MFTTMSIRRELAHRVTDGIGVWLYWEQADDSLRLEVYDWKGEDYFEIEVPRDRALDAFHHPYAYRAAAEEPPEPVRSVC